MLVHSVNVNPLIRIFFKIGSYPELSSNFLLTSPRDKHSALEMQINKVSEIKSENY